MPKVTEIEKEIKAKYLKAPTIAEIDEFISFLGVSRRQFEVYFGIPKGVIQLVVMGERNLPVKFWPIFYERIVPTYGIKYRKKVQKRNKPTITKKSTNQNPVINVKRLNDL